MTRRIFDFGRGTFANFRAPEPLLDLSELSRIVASTPPLLTSVEMASSALKQLETRRADERLPAYPGIKLIANPLMPKRAAMLHYSDGSSMLLNLESGKASKLPKADELRFRYGGEER